MQFYQLAIGAQFECRGLRYRKTPRSFAESIGDGPPERGHGGAFMHAMEIISDGPFLTEAEIGWFRPSERPWTDYLSPAPGCRPPARESGVRCET